MAIANVSRSASTMYIYMHDHDHEQLQVSQSVAMATGIFFFTACMAVHLDPQSIIIKIKALQLKKHTCTLFNLLSVVGGL